MNDFTYESVLSYSGTVEISHLTQMIHELQQPRNYQNNQKVNFLLNIRQD